MRFLLLAAVLVAFLVALYAAWHFGTAFVRMAKATDWDPELTGAHVKKYVDDTIPVFHLPEVLRSSAAPKVSLIPAAVGVITIDPTRMVGTITAETLAHRRQYEFNIWNETEETFVDVELRFQTPYPIEFADLPPRTGALDVSFVPDLRATITVSGSGSVSNPRAITRAWKFHA